MIVKRNFRPSKILPFVWKELTFVGVVATLVCVLYIEGGVTEIALPFGPLGVLGTALAIFLAFRNNAGYARWWEARTIWAQIVSNSRAIGRQIIAAGVNAGKLDKGGGAEALVAYRREMLHRQIAFAHALRLQLRGQELGDVLAPLLPAAELERVRASHNRPNMILMIQGERLKDGVREEKLGQFDPVSLEPSLAALHAAQSNCERIKQTPMLRQFEFFTRVFLWMFLALVPSSILGMFGSNAARWTTIPIALAIGFIYAITNKTAQVTEDPFDNTTHDVPMSALCNTIERDLREQLGESDLPPRAEPVDGYLF